MADTTNTEVLVSEGWKEVIATGSGFFTASKSCQYCIAQSLPADTFYGHRLTNFEDKIYVLQTLEKVYLKTSKDLILVVTGE